MVDVTSPGSSAERQRLVLDQMQLAYIEISSALVVTEWSPAAERIFEWGRTEALGRKVFDLLVPADAQTELGRVLRTLMQTGEGTSGTSENVTRSGRRIVCDWYNVVLRDAEGAVAGLASLAQDVTGRAQAERALVECETKLRALFENSRDAIGVSVAGVHTFVNPAYLRMFGFDRPEELVGQLVVDLIAPEERAVIGERVRRRAAGAPVEDRYETRGLRRDGTTFDMEVVVSAFDQHGEQQTLVFLRDVTGRNQMVRSLETSERRFRALIEKSHDAVSLLDARGRVTYHSPSYEKVTGRPPASRLGGAFLDTVHPDDSGQVAEAFGRLLRSPGQMESLTIRTQHASGEWRWTEVVASNQLSDPAVAGVVVNFRDVTERVRAEEERHKLEQQVRHVQKLESLGVLAGGIAHDFNNLLMAIMGHASLALAELPALSPARESVGEIEKAARRAAELTKQMLAYSGKGRFQVHTVDLGELVRDMTSMLEVSVSKKAVLRLEVTPGLPPVEVDLAQVRQVVMNLVINASDALGERSGVVAVVIDAMPCDQEYLSATLLDDRLPEGTYVTLDVTDTGCGMDAETKAKIFDPFFTTKFAGRGLGLAAVLGIVRGHKGAIQVQSQPGRGSTFRVLLPASPQAAEALEPSGATPRGWRGVGTVLLADDEESVRATGKKMLQILGFEVEVASHGREAVERFAETPDRFAAVLLDLTMPHLDGAEALEEIRRVRPEATIILSSGYTEQDVAERFAGRGFTGFLQKPYGLDDLTRVMRSVLPKAKLEP